MCSAYNITPSPASHKIQQIIITSIPNFTIQYYIHVPPSTAIKNSYGNKNIYKYI